MFVDLHDACMSLTATTLEERVAELASIIPIVSITAIGGFPILRKFDVLTWCDSSISFPRLQHIIKEALGSSAVLTYTNKNNKPLNVLGDICSQRKHLWAYHWLNMTLTFASYPHSVELSFARDTRFFLSWPVIENAKVFSATGSLHSWSKYLSNKRDMSFDAHTRGAMFDAYALIGDLCS
jgi:hypothetical protein